VQIRSENIVAFTLPSAVEILLFILHYRIITMPDSVFYIGVTICSIAIVLSILAITPLWNRLFSIRPATVPIMTDYSNTIREYGREPSNKPPSALNYILIASSIIMLLFGSLAAYFWLTGGITGQINLYWIMFFAVFIGIPILTLLDIFVWEKKYYKLGKSARHAEKTITVKDNINNIFNRGLRVLNIKPTETSVIKIDRPKLIKAQIAGFIVTIKTRHVLKGLVNIYILSDSRWLTTKFDWGVNQKNVDKIDRLIHSVTD